MGDAFVDKNACLPHSMGINCVICLNVCPANAIQFEVHPEKRTKWGEEIKIPKIDQKKCTGCLLCEYRCPVDGGAIHIIKSY